jgi:hypothetical protein
MNNTSHSHVTPPASGLPSRLWFLQVKTVQHDVSGDRNVKGGFSVPGGWSRCGHPQRHAVLSSVLPFDREALLTLRQVQRLYTAGWA